MNVFCCNSLTSNRKSSKVFECLVKLGDMVKLKKGENTEMDLIYVIFFI